MSPASSENRMTPVFLPFILELPVIQVLTQTPKSAILPCSRALSVSKALTTTAWSTHLPCRSLSQTHTLTNLHRKAQLARQRHPSFWCNHTLTTNGSVAHLCGCSSLADVIRMRCPPVQEWRRDAIKWHQFKGFWHANALPRGEFVPAFVTGTDC